MIDQIVDCNGNGPYRPWIPYRERYPSTDHTNVIITAVWVPIFKNDDGKEAVMKHYSFVTGQPDCDATQHRPIYYLPYSEDE